MLDAGFDLGIAVGIEMLAIELGDAVEHLAAGVARDARRVVEVEHRIAAGAKPHALIFGRQKAAAPQAREQRLVGVDAVGLRDHHDERRQVVVLAAEAVADPRAHAGASGLLAAGLDEGDGRIVIDGVGVDGFDDGEVVDDFGGVRQQFADPGAGLAVLFEAEEARRDGKRGLAGRHAGDALAHADGVGQVDALTAS